MDSKSQIWLWIRSQDRRMTLRLILRRWLFWNWFVFCSIKNFLSISWTSSVCAMIVISAGIGRHNRLTSRSSSSCQFWSVMIQLWRRFLSSLIFGHCKTWVILCFYASRWSGQMESKRLWNRNPAIDNTSRSPTQAWTSSCTMWLRFLTSRSMT